MVPKNPLPEAFGPLADPKELLLRLLASVLAGVHRLL